MKTINLFQQMTKPLILLFLTTVLAACGGETTVDLPGNSDDGLENLVQTSGTSYAGPNPTDADVLKFQSTLWSFVVDSEKCGGCHSNVNGQTDPQFARIDDVNLAYAAVQALIDREDPENSPMVVKVREGHNCWAGSTNASFCAGQLQTKIENWMATEDAGTAQTVELRPLNEVSDPGSTKTLPSTLPADEAEKNATIFAQCIYPLLTNGDTSSCSVPSVASHQSIGGTNYCGNCHKPNGIEGSQSPFFASDDIDTAYAAVRSKIDIESPASSRIVVRLRNEFHNCFSDCAEDASLFEAAITELSNNIDTQEVEPGTVFSKRQILLESTIASNGGRYEDSAVALYNFKEGSGNKTADKINGINLTLNDDVSWVGGWGIRFQGGQAGAAADPETTKTLINAIQETGELSIEAWVVPGNVSQEGPARIVTISSGETERNIMLGQTLYNYDFSLRNTMSDLNGEPMLSTPDDDEALQATLQHVVATFHPLEGRKIYVNGELITTDADQGFEFGNLNNWDKGLRLFLGEEVGHKYSWDGIIRMLAFHNKALTPEQIMANYDAGVGQKYYMMFYVSHLINDVDASSPSYIDDAYIVFEASEFDDYSYLFANPFFVVLGDAPATIPEIPMEGMRIGINGKEATVGQAFNHESVTLGGSSYQAEGQPLIKIGSILAKEKGAAEDQFYLTFKRIGNKTDARTNTETFTPVVPEGDDTAILPSVGIKTFEEVDASMSAMTGVPRSSVQSTYELVKQQLPSAPQMNGFLSAHQVGIAQMAIAYCNTLVNDANLRSSYFPGFNFDQSVNNAFTDQADLNLILDPLMNHMMSIDTVNAIELSDMPPKADDVDGDGVRTMLTNLVRDLEVCDSAEQTPDPTTGEAECSPPSSSQAEIERTSTVVKATCAALLGSAVMLVQ